MMIPLSDVDRRPTTFPIMTALIIAANVIVFLVELANGPSFIYRWSVQPDVVMSGHRLVTILTAMFMHASWLHIIGNMVFLWAFGPEVEDAMGHGRYLVFYLLSGVVAMAVQVLADPHSSIPCLGASGAIAGVMGAFLITFPTDRIKTVLVIFYFVTIKVIPAVILIGLWLLTQVLSEVGQLVTHQSGGVAYLAHIGGIAFGMLTARFFEGDNDRAAQ